MSESPPWSYRLRWSEIQRASQHLDLVADELALVRVAKALDAEAISGLRADIDLRPWLDGIEISGRIIARVTRLCGLSLEPFEEAVDTPFLVRIVPAGSPHAPTASAELVVDLDADDPPDVLEGDTIDLGGYLTEYLALALDPFPRKPGAVFEPVSTGALLSPFAVLAQLKKPQSES